MGGNKVLGEVWTSLGLDQMHDYVDLQLRRHDLIIKHTYKSYQFSLLQNFVFFQKITFYHLCLNLIPLLERLNPVVC